jgi:hypothetical protein
MNEENFQKFTNKSKNNKFRGANGRKRNKRETRNARYTGKQIINDLINDGDSGYNRQNDDKN